ncbi:MAG: DNA recombination protein RmuC [Pseudomonadales bacterium]|nr:DNA recombination protein RmuC [Pseudomonadales bacterium]
MDGTMITIALAAFAGLTVGCLLTAGWMRRRHRRAIDAVLSHEAHNTAIEKRLMEERLEVRSRAAERAEAELASTQRELRERSEQHQEATAKSVHLGTENSQLSAQLSKAREESSAARADAEVAKVQLAEIRTRLSETEKGFREKEALFKEASEALKQEFQLLANQIFEQHGEKLRTTSTEQLNSVLRPFKEQITDFKRRVEEVYTTDAKDRASLLTEVRNLQEASERVNREAESLTRALKGDTRVQGNWGEVVLERVLTDSGLRRDHEYVVQASFRNEGGELKRPDVIIHLPGDKDVVIDAKVSLAAYEQALALGDEAAREDAITRHVQSLRNHVRNLGSQDYDRLEGVRSLDFVLLFIPVEAAFTMAMERDPAIFAEAFEKRLVIVSPTTLMMTLRIIDNVWRYEKQSRNAQEIARRAGALYDKVRVILEDMDQLGKSLGTAKRSYDSAYARLVSGKGNLVRQVEQFRELGADVKKALPRDLVEAAND